MFRGPFAFLTVLLGLAVLAPMALPLLLLIGYPCLLAAVAWVASHRDGRRAELAAVWVTYLGVLLTLTGITMCIDTPLAGSSPTDGERRLWSAVAYSGGGIAALAAFAGFALRVRRRAAIRPAEDAAAPSPATE